MKVLHVKAFYGKGKKTGKKKLMRWKQAVRRIQLENE
jgi:hypothetical protein